MKLHLKTIIILVLATAPLLHSQSLEQDRKLGRLFAKFAWEACNSSYWEDFEAMTNKGLEYDDQNPDLLCFKGFLFQRKGDYLAAETWYARAYYSGFRPDQLDISDILSGLFEMNYRLERYESLEAIYFSLHNPDNPDVLFYTVMALGKQKKFSRAMELAREGLYRYQDQRFLIFLSSRDKEYIKILSEYIKRQGIQHPDLLATTILETGNGTVLASLYIQYYNDINSWYFKKNLLNLPLGDSFPSLPPHRIWSLKVILDFLEHEEDPHSTLSQMAPLALDKSADGIADLFVRKEGRNLVWSGDSDQDGTMNSVLYWDASGKLQTLIARDAKGSTKFQYYDYPYIDKVLISAKEKNQREYLFLPGNYALSLDGDDRSLLLSLLKMGGETRMVPESSLLSSCFSLLDSVVKPKVHLFREYSVVEGMIIKFREDSNFDGFFDRVVFLNQWLPYEGHRDIDNDGEYDLKEKYIGGRLAAFEFEGEDSRVEEYQDFWNKKRYQLWDFSKNNFYDAQLQKNEEGRWIQMPFKGMDS